MGSLNGVWGRYKAGLELILIRAIWLFPYIMRPSCGCPSFKRPTIWGLCSGLLVLETPRWLD